MLVDATALSVVLCAAGIWVDSASLSDVHGDKSESISAAVVALKMLETETDEWGCVSLPGSSDDGMLVVSGGGVANSIASAARISSLDGWVAFFERRACCARMLAISSSESKLLKHPWPFGKARLITVKHMDSDESKSKHVRVPPG